MRQHQNLLQLFYMLCNDMVVCVEAHLVLLGCLLYAA